MFSTVSDWWCFILLTLRLFGVRGSVSICDYRSKNEVIIVALVNVHDEGTNCARISLRGLQQMAVLEKTIGEINDRDAPSEGLHLALHIVDTCSSSNDELSAVLKNLVTSHQTCLNPPLLLGFIGPERHLRSTQQITSEFHKFHVLPFEPDWKVSSQANNLLLYVGNRRLELRSKILLSILNQLKWRSVYVLVGDNIAISEVLEHILNEIEHVCVTGLVKIPGDASAISSFYSTVQKGFEESESDGIIVFAEDPNNIRPFLRAMEEEPNEEQTPSSPPFLFYLNHIGLKSWELPRNHTILLLQETSDMSKDFDLRAHHNQTLWNEYYVQYGIDYKRDAFADQYDPSVALFEYASQLYWNAAKYAKRIKCDLGSNDVSSGGVCYDMLHASPSEWKTFLLKAVYHHSISLRKISFGMNAPVVVKVYFVNRIVNFPQLIGRITDIGIMDMKMDLHTAIPTTPKNNLRKCIPPPTKDSSFNPFPLDHESNWLAVFSKKMKNLIQLDGWVSRETNEKINNVVSWFLGFVMFILGLILITKCVYTIFRVQTEDERAEARRRKTGRTSRIVST